MKRRRTMKRLAKPGKYRVVIYRGKRKMDQHTIRYPNEGVRFYKTSKSFRSKYKKKLKSKHYRKV